MNVNTKYMKFAIVAFFATALSAWLGGDFGMAEQMGAAYALISAISAIAPRNVLGYSNLVGADNEPDFSAIAQEVKNVVSKLNSTKSELEGFGREFKERLEKGEKVSEKITGDLDTLMTKFGDLSATVKDLEQKSVSGNPNNGPKSAKSIGEQFVESEGFKAFNGDGKMSVKATITTTLAGGSAGDGLMTPVYRDGDLVRIPRRTTVDDLIPSIAITSSAVDFARQLTRNNAAAPVAEGGAKPYSDYSWESATVPVRTLAHLAKVTRQAWEDAPRLMGEINSEMIYGLDLLRESQILFGNGTGQNFHGIVPQATEYAAPTGAPTTGLTRIDVIRLAVLNVMLRGYAADGIVLNAADWAFIEMGKDGQGRYLVSDPHNGATKRLWSLPVLDTMAMPQDNFLVGAFRIGATYYRRMGIEVKLSTENDKDFENNLGTLRAEERGALAVKRAAAFETGTFTAALAVGGGA